jgi:hypothetical protein
MEVMAPRTKERAVKPPSLKPHLPSASALPQEMRRKTSRPKAMTK